MTHTTHEEAAVLDADRMGVAMGAVRDQVLAVCRGHEEEAHAGDPCPGNRLSALAFLFHCLGFRADQEEAWEHLRELAAGYDARCEKGRCEHDAGGEDPG